MKVSESIQRQKKLHKRYLVMIPILTTYQAINTKIAQFTMRERRDKTWQQNKQLSTQEQENVKVRALKSVPLVDGFWAKNNGRWH